jgi:hypothetical protein
VWDVGRRLWCRRLRPFDLYSRFQASCVCPAFVAVPPCLLLVAPAHVLACLRACCLPACLPARPPSAGVPAKRGRFRGCAAAVAGDGAVCGWCGLLTGPHRLHLHGGCGWLSWCGADAELPWLPARSHAVLARQPQQRAAARTPPKRTMCGTCTCVCPIMRACVL